MSDGSGSTGWTYDNRGRMTQETKAITGSGTFKTQWGYNSADLVSSMTYPSNASGGTGEVVNFTYLNQMVLDTVSGTSTYVYNTDYEPAGRVTLRELGASSLIDNHYTYFDWTAVNGQGRLSTIISHKSTPDLQNLAYTYDANGNVLTIQDWMDKTGNNPQTQTFTYDALDRLTSAVAVNGTNGTYALQNYTYSPSTGNLASKAGVNYTYDTTHKHAVAATNNGMNYAYDGNGNQTQRSIPSISEINFAYDAENRLVGVSGDVTATFTYDGDGNRVKGAITGGSTTTYVGNYFEWVSSTSNMKKYYYAGATRVAMRTGPSTLNYLLGDHLGSQAITTNSSGVRIAEIRYYPWGTTRYTYGTSPTTYQYTGQRVETSLGLLFYNARWYDSSLGRFIQADTIVPGAGNPQAYDRYAYTLNNPLKYTDPSGNNYCESKWADPVDCAEADPDGDGIVLLFPAISLEDISDIGHPDEVLQQYTLIRRWLYARYDSEYIDMESGMINDQVILAIIVASEFGTFIQDSAVYGEALEGLSNQYYSIHGMQQTPCRGGCTLITQLIWLQTIQAFYSGFSYSEMRRSGDSWWQSHLESAGRSMKADFQYGPTDESWIWGNVDTDSQMGYWIFYGEGVGTKYVVANLDRYFVVLTVNQMKQMRSNGWHIGTGPFWGPANP